jgi:hypothetical protein
VHRGVGGQGRDGAGGSCLWRSEAAHWRVDCCQAKPMTGGGTMVGPGGTTIGPRGTTVGRVVWGLGEGQQKRQGLGRRQWQVLGRRGGSGWCRCGRAPCARAEGSGIGGQARSGKRGCGRVPMRERIGSWSEEVGDLAELGLLDHRFGLLDTVDA